MSTSTKLFFFFLLPSSSPNLALDLPFLYFVHPLPSLVSIVLFYFLPTEGDYDVTIPVDSEAGKYKIRVGLFGDDSVYACSAAFEIAPAGETLWVEGP